MPTEISKTEFKARALEILRRIESSDESMVITDHGKPRVELRRYTPAVENPLNRLRGSVTRYDDPLAPVGEGDWQALGNND